MKRSASVALAASFAAIAACGGEAETSSTTTTGVSTTTTTTTPTPWVTGGSGGTGGVGGSGGSGGCVDTGPVTSTFVPTPADIQFAAVSPLPHGEQILFNDWAASPNYVASTTPDGATTTRVFEAYRVWSMGVAPSGAAIAFSSGDPDQAAHYGGLTLGDAIQHTWIYDTAAETAKLVAGGNINDECHVFGPGEATLYLCRRYDFTLCMDNQPYRLGRIDLATGAFSFLLPEEPPHMTLSPQPFPDGSGLLYERIELDPPNMRHAVWKLPLPSGAPAELDLDRSSPALSPDGTRYLFGNDNDGGRLYVSNLDGTGAVRVSPGRGQAAVWSPDGTKIAYLGADPSAGCDHIQTVLADGTTADAPTVVRDCTQHAEFITQLAWITRP